MKQIVTVVISLVCLLVLAKAQMTGDVESEIRELERQRFRAMEQVDVAMLDHILSDDLIYTHANGLQQTKAELIGVLGSGDISLGRWNELPNYGAFVPDVREQEEFRRGAIGAAVNIPLHQLRQGLSELSKDRPVWVNCARGQRSYYAVRILQQHGFDASNLAGGYNTWEVWYPDGLPSAEAPQMEEPPSQIARHERISKSDIPLSHEHLDTMRDRGERCGSARSYGLTPSLRRKVIIGHQFVNADWKRLSPTKAVKRYHFGLIQ